MRGFLGCVTGKVAGAEAMFRWMSDWIGIEPRKQTCGHQRAPFRYLASVEPDAEEGPVAVGEDGVILAFHGFLARDQFQEKGRAAPVTDYETAQVLLRFYREQGGRGLAGLNGRYVACVWDPGTATLELANDCLGYLPVFLWQRGSTFAFSSNVWALASHSDFEKAVDPRGLVDLLLLSHQQDDRTLFRDVSILPPGSTVTVRDGTVSRQPVRTLRFSEESWTWSIDRIADTMYDRLAKSTERWVPDGAEVLLPLSGGFDSRVLLGLLSGRPVDIQTVTQYQHGLFGLDSRYARRLARVAGVPHQVVPFGDDVFARFRQRCVSINGGMYDIHTGRFLSLLEQSEAGRRSTVSAHLGGELTSRFQISDTRFSTPEEHFRLAFAGVNQYRFTVETVRALLSDGLSEDLADEAVAESRRFFLDFDGPFFHRFLNWDLLVSRRRYISYQLLYYDQFQPVKAPFYDREFVDYMCSVPFAAVEGQRAYMQMMRRHMSDLARIPNTNTDLPVVVSTKAVVRDFLNSQYRRFLHRPLNRMLRLRRWNPHPQEQYGYALRGESKPVVDYVVDNRDRLAPYLRPGVLQDAVDRLWEGDNSQCMGLLGLSAFTTALEMLEDPRLALAAWEAAGAGRPGATSGTRAQKESVAR